jgi:hypothetical protein
MDHRLSTEESFRAGGVIVEFASGLRAPWWRTAAGGAGPWPPGLSRSRSTDCRSLRGSPTGWKRPRAREGQQRGLQQGH